MESKVFPLLGTIGSLLFAFCLAPVVYDVMATHDVTHVSWCFTLMSLAANLLTGSYVLYRDMMVDNTRHVPLYVNYSVATFFCLLLLFYKVLFVFADGIDETIKKAGKDHACVTRVELADGTYRR